ncbi:NAD(P)/FAD-dependent oxidoreductase [Flavonifractor hominis]|uniref:FAD-dependent protein n=1 Tax=Flavonifractor hominis TaxID=3133178 RepID=A0ABV1ES22_9FIRM
MIRIQNIALPLDGGEAQLRQKAARALGLKPDAITALTLARQSIDARKKSQVHYVCTVDVTVENEARIMARCRDKNVSLYQSAPYVFPPVRRTSSLPPVVVGMGPAGLFAALFLARNGLAPIVLERGRPVEERTADVEQFWSTGVLDPASNVQFGEGGAGTFSDGKLNTGTHDPRISTVFRELVAAGAPEDILYQHKPHIGTDVLRDVVKHIRLELIRLGCDVRFGHKLTGLTLRDGAVAGLSVECPQGAYALPCDALVLSPGHSARDTFRMLHEAGVPMEQKSFAIGVRIEHPQAAVSLAQFGPAWEKLPAADYKLACHLPNGRSAFTFCVCPGGQVVAAASEEGRLVTNGMSHRARDGKNINGGFLVGVNPADFGSDHPLAGVEYQRRWEEAAFTLGGGNYHAPAQTVKDFLAHQASKALGTVEPTYRPGVVPADLDRCLPRYITDTLRGALPVFDRKLHGFAAPDSLLTGVETRSSSPVRILRGEDFQSTVRGLYPCGEGAGYAGGITSAAVDGIRVAEAVAGQP